MGGLGKFKLSDAVPGGGKKKSAAGRPKDALTPAEADVELSNARVNSGVKSNKDRMVDTGRGVNTAGRGK